MGSLEVICGPMFSGKTEELLRRMKREEIAGKRVTLLKPSLDNRYDDNYIVTHDKNKRKRAIPLSRLRDYFSYVAYNYTDVLGIDEIQFFQEKDQIDFIKRLTSFNKVIVSGLDTDFRHEPFGDMPYLLAIADKIDKLTAICVQCGNEATRTQRLINGHPAPYDSPIILVGGTEQYEARCRICHECPREP